MENLAIVQHCIYFHIPPFEEVDIAFELGNYVYS
jgi:hypothetical protein